MASCIVQLSKHFSINLTEREWGLYVMNAFTVMICVTLLRQETTYG